MNGYGSYKFADNLFALASVNYIQQSYLGSSYNGTTVTGTVTYWKQVWGGVFSSSFSVSDSVNSTTNQSNLGFAALANYSRQIGGWNVSGSGNYSQSQQTALIGYTTSGFGFNGNVGHKLGRWGWNAGAGGSKSLLNVPGYGNSSQFYSTSLTGRLIGVKCELYQEQRQLAAGDDRPGSCAAATGHPAYGPDFLWRPCLWVRGGKQPGSAAPPELQLLPVLQQYAERDYGFGEHQRKHQRPDHVRLPAIVHECRIQQICAGLQRLGAPAVNVKLLLFRNLQMVQLLLVRGSQSKALRVPALMCAILLALTPAMAAGGKSKKATEVTVPVLLLPEGRKLVFERSFSSQREMGIKRGFWNKLVDIIAGPPEWHHMERPYSVVTDSHDRVIVTDPGALGIHIFDFQQQRYHFISHTEGKDPLRSPQCVAVDKQDNIYVTDSEAGKIFVFDPGGKLRHVIGSIKGGEGFYKRPTGIAVDSDEQRIYVTDTLRNKIFVLDMQGSVLQTIGKNGSGEGEFNFPTELRLHGKNLLVVDAMNFRIQEVDRSGQFQYAIGKLGDSDGDMFRPKGVGLDSEGHIYVVEGLSNLVQVFDQQGQLLYYFGRKGTGFGDFQAPAGLFVDHNDRVFVVDSYNRRVEVFRYYAVAKKAAGGMQ